MRNEDMGQITGISKAREIMPLVKEDAFVIVENERGEILLQRGLGKDYWELPKGEHLNEEPGLHLAQFSLYQKLNEVAIYMAKAYFGTLKTKVRSSEELSFFSLYDLPLDFQE